MRGAFVSEAAFITITAVLGLLGSNPINAARHAPASTSSRMLLLIS